MLHSLATFAIDLRFTVVNICLHFLQVDFAHFCILRLLVHVNVQNVLGYWLEYKIWVNQAIVNPSTPTYNVACFVVFILDNEDHIESWKDSSLEVDILGEFQRESNYCRDKALDSAYLAGCLHVIIATEYRVCCSEYGSSWI